MAINFPEQFKKADNLRNGARTAEAVSLYNDIAAAASYEDEPVYEARAFHMAGTTLKATISPNRQSAYQEAVGYFRKALELFQTQGDAVGSAGVLRDLGSAADRAHDFANALLSYQKSISILLENDEAAGELAITYDKLGLHFARQGQFETALTYMDKAMDTFRLSPRSGFFRATTLLDRASVLFKLKRYEDALYVAHESLSWFEADHGKENYDMRLAQLNGLIGLTQQRLGVEKMATRHLKTFELLLKKFDIEAADTLRRELETLSKEG